MSNNFLYWKIFFGALLLCSRSVYAGALVYAGMGMGPAQSTADKQFDLEYGVNLFVGVQTEYYITYELGVVRFVTKNSPGENEDKVLTQVTGSVLGHLPIGDSSLFARVGASLYQYRNSSEQLDDVAIPTVGAGLDFGIKPLITLRLEWQRYIGVEYNSTEFDIDNTRLGLIFYF